MKAFSIFENTRMFLNTEGGNSSMKVLNGIRFLSTTWVIIFHRFFVMMFLPNINSIDLQDVSIKYTINLKNSIEKYSFFNIYLPINN